MLSIPSSLASSLYCAEDADEVDADASWADDVDESLSPARSSLRPKQQHHQPSIDPRSAISYLVAAEPDHCPLPGYLSRLHDRSIDATSRQDCISWILKVHEFYRFRPVTACLAVNYFDRFLSANSLPQGNDGWPWQLLSVACLSVAAKMEETQVPLLLDLQLFDPKFVFDPKTIGRMELLLMSSLQWRMWSVTPFDFLDHLASFVPPDCLSAARYGFLLSRASDLILDTLRVVDFMAYKPSAIGAAALLCAIGGEIGGDFPSDDCLSCFSDFVSKETVEECRQMMDEYLIDTCPEGIMAKREISRPELTPPTPHSPVGVLDAAACGSCDTQRSASVVQQIRAEPAPPPRPSKRRRVSGSAGSTHVHNS